MHIVARYGDNTVNLCMVKYAHAGDTNTVDLHEYGCHVMPCMTKVIENCQKEAVACPRCSWAHPGKADAFLMVWHVLGFISCKLHA